MGRRRGEKRRELVGAYSIGCISQKKAGQYGESGAEWEEWERSQNLNKNISSGVLNNSTHDKVRLFNTNDGIESFMNLPPITARAANATELRVFMTEEEKEYLKKVARKKGTTVTHLLRALALGWASEQDETA